jgi:hypothetical protein
MTRTRKVAAGAAGIVVAGLVSRRLLHDWGATSSERAATLPSDESIPDPASGASTRAVTVEAPAPVVWRWLVQMGQDRGGMYSYERLENLFRLDIHNADEIREEWQHLAAGDRVRVVPPGRLGMPEGYSFRVEQVEPDRAIVLRQKPPEHPWDATWAFVLVPLGKTRCRLLSRSRSARLPGARGLLASVGDLVLDPITLLMTRRMLLGIKERAEREGMPAARER